VFSILVVGGSTLAFALVTILDVGHQEAFQLLNNIAGIFYALTYVVMFAIPLKDPSAPGTVRGAAFSGLAMTLLYIALSIFPIIEVKNRGVFTAKIIGVVLLANLAAQSSTGAPDHAHPKNSFSPMFSYLRDIIRSLKSRHRVF
jgi:hypothetical protein